MTHDAYQQGQEARRDGKPRSANPYTKRQAASAREWDRGWDEADFGETHDTLD